MISFYPHHSHHFSDYLNIHSSSKKTNFNSSSLSPSPTQFPYHIYEQLQQHSHSHHHINVNKPSKSKRLTKTFHKQFQELKTQLNIQNTRKTHIDSLLKKIKSKCLKAIHEVLKNCLNLLVGRLPQNFITNIKIDFNKHYLDKTIGDIYFDFKLLPSYNEIYEKNLIRKGKNALFNEIYNMQFKEVYNTYLESNLFVKDFEKIKGRDGEEIALLYEYVAKNMCEYYLLSKGNKSKSEITNQRNNNNINDESTCSFNNESNRYNSSVNNNNNNNINENNLNSFSMNNHHQINATTHNNNKKLVFNINNE